MDAAYDLIWEYSYGAVTIDAICERAAVKKGSFYYFFESKSDLAITAIEAWWTKRQIIMLEIFRADSPPLERIRSYMDFISTHQIQSYEKKGYVPGCPLHALGAEICTQDKQIRSQLEGILDNITTFFAQAIGDAQALGQIEGAQTAQKARALMAYYAGVLTQARIRNNIESLRSLGSDSLDLLGAHPPAKSVPPLPSMPAEPRAQLVPSL